MSDETLDETTSDVEMPDEVDEETDDAASDSNADAGTAEEETPAQVRRYLAYAAIFGLAVLAFVAVVQFYLSATGAIATWIQPEYRALFRALFNLAVFLLAALGIGRLLTRLD